MSAVRVRTPGNNPETRIVCDWTSARGDPTSRPVVWLGENSGRLDYCHLNNPWCACELCA